MTLVGRGIESILGGRLVEEGDQKPDIVVLAMMFFRNLTPSRFDLLVARELVTNSDDPLKVPGVVSWAGAETAKVIDGQIEPFDLHWQGSLSEEILAGLPEGEIIRLSIIDFGNYWYRHTPNVLARLAVIKALSSIPDSYFAPFDGEVSKPWWVNEQELSMVKGWREGMEDSGVVVPALAAYSYAVWQTGEEGVDWVEHKLTGADLSGVRNYRSRFPDSKRAKFNWP